MEADALSRALDTADEEVLPQLCEAAGEAVTRWGFPVEVSPRAPRRRLRVLLARVRRPPGWAPARRGPPPAPATP